MTDNKAKAYSKHIQVTIATLVYPEPKNAVETRLQTIRIAKVNNSGDIKVLAKRRKNIDVILS